MTSIGQGHGTDDQDADEHTIELEGDISALLKNADDTQDGDDDSKDTEEADHTMELEADMGSLLETVSAGVTELRRLSASSAGGIGSATKTSPTSHHITVVALPSADDEFERMIAGGAPPVDLSAVKLDLCAVEIVGFCERGGERSFDQAVHSIKSVLVDACNSAQHVAPPLMSLTSPAKKTLAAQYTSEIVVSTIYEVLSAASEEVLKKVEQTKDGGSTILETVRATNPDLLKAIQVGIRKHDNAEFHAKIRALYSKVKDSVIGEWKVWEAACSSALLKALEDRRDGLAKDGEEIAEKEKALEAAFASVQAVKGRVAKKARKVSLDRKVAAAKEVKAEVEDLEEQLRKAEAELLSCSEKAAHATIVAQHYIESQRTKKELAAVSKKRKSGEKKFKSLEGLLMWSPVLIDSSKVIVDFSGGEMAETKVSLGFDLKNEAGIQVFMMEKKVRVYKSRSNELRKLVLGLLAS